MNSDILILLKLSSLFLVLFAIAELLYHFLNVSAEHTRKLVHIGTGILTLLFPFYFQHLWQVAVICFSFFLLLSISIRFRFLKSINAVSRQTVGSLLYPVIVVIAFSFYLFMSNQQAVFEKKIYFMLPVIVMAVSDPVAAMAGNWYKKRRQMKAGKTFFGSAIFLISAFVITLALLWYGAVVPLQAVALMGYSFAIALVAAVAEYVSSKGWDNFTIPVVIMMLLYFSKGMIL